MFYNCDAPDQLPLPLSSVNDFSEFEKFLENQHRGKGCFLASHIYEELLIEEIQCLFQIAILFPFNRDEEGIW